ncbi:MAG: hypothetical protein AB1540_10885 [Bdellovibrionota bacterium]
MQTRARNTALAAVVAVVFFFFLAILALNTSFWCDEFGWVGATYGSIQEAIQVVAKDVSPHIFLDGFFMAIFSKAALNLGINPHLAIRLHTVVLAVLFAMLPWFIKTLSHRERWIWTGWAILNCALVRMAVNSRPYASILFFSAVALFAAIEFSRSKGVFSRIALVLSILLTLGPLTHVYVMMPITLYAVLVLASRTDLKSKLKFLAPLLPGVLVCFWWFVFFKPHSYLAVSWNELFSRLMATPWLDYARQILGGFSNPGKRSLIVAPLVGYGIFIQWKKDKRLCLFLMAALFSGIAVPLYLDRKYNYFFVPRQTFTALPFWGWFVVVALDQICFSKIRRPAVSTAVLAMLTLVVGLIPLYRLIENIPPFVDQPRLKLREAVAQLKPDQKLIVLSSCNRSTAGLYVYPDYMKEMFERYRKGQPPEERPTEERVPFWDSSSLTCFGNIPENSPDAELMKEVQSHPERFLVLAPFDVRVPSRLRHVECVSEINGPCVR